MRSKRLRPLRVQFPYKHRLPAEGCLVSVRFIPLLLEQLVQQLSEEHGVFIGLQKRRLQMISAEWPESECAGEEPAELLSRETCCQSTMQFHAT